MPKKLLSPHKLPTKLEEPPGITVEYLEDLRKKVCNLPPERMLPHNLKGKVGERLFTLASRLTPRCI